MSAFRRTRLRVGDTETGDLGSKQTSFVPDQVTDLDTLDEFDPAMECAAAEPRAQYESSDKITESVLEVCLELTLDTDFKILSLLLIFCE